MKIIYFFFFSAFLAMSLPQSVFASVTTGSFLVQVTVTGACSLTTANLTFPAYQPLSGTDDTGSTTLTVTCTTGTSYTVALDKGANASTFTPRRLKNTAGTDFLNYNLYSSTAYTTIWGDGTGGTSLGPFPTSPATGTGSAQIWTVYGKIPAGQTTAIGGATYQDTINVTVTF